MKTFLMVSFVLCLLLSGSIAGAESIGLLGQVDGIRDVPSTRELAVLEAQRFELLQAGKADEAARLLRERILPLRAKLEDLRSWIDCHVYTGGEPNQMTVYLYFAPTSEKEGLKFGIDAHYVQFFPTLEQFERIFHGRESLREFPVSGGVFFDTLVSTTVTATGRTIVIQQQDRLDDEVLTVKRRQTCRIIVANDLITRLEVEKERKNLLGKFSTVFSAAVTGLYPTASGLRLIGLFDYGRINNPTRIRAALADKTDQTFRRLAKEEK